MERHSDFRASNIKLIDSCGRKINYLRLSVTDRCNMCCHYCAPREHGEQLEQNELLSFADLESLTRSAIAAGIQKVRITGGEPLVRPGVIEFLARIRKLPGLQRLVLTTNGMLLPFFAGQLAAAGVDSLNVSLDSLNPERFKEITGVAGLGRVLAGIDAALDAGIRVKLNMVPMRGINDDEILKLLNYACERGISLRFIEYMPVYRPVNWQNRIISGTEILERLSREFDLEEQARLPLDGPAKYYRLAGKQTTVGLISPVFEHICNACNRIRITSAGRMRSCLFSDQELDLRPFLGLGQEQELICAFQKVIFDKPESHHLHQQDQGYRSFAMSAVGG